MNVRKHRSKLVTAIKYNKLSPEWKDLFREVGMAPSRKLLVVLNAFQVTIFILILLAIGGGAKCLFIAN